MKRILLFSLLISNIFFGTARGQEPESNETPPVSIPENIKQEVVRRILAYKFNPQKRRKIVYLSKAGLDALWLPAVSNVEFHLLSDQEFEDRTSDIYFFTEPKLNGKIYNIGLAFGDPDCGYSGDTWNFRLIGNRRLRLWPAGGFGNGCGAGDREFKTAGALNIYSNELKGYQFFDQGKLKGLKITVSTRADVKQNFGSDCESDCDYNGHWKISFAYFGTISKEKTIDNKKITYIPKSELLGKISSIRLTPKQRLAFSRINFPRDFNESYSFSVGDNFNSEGHLTAAVGTSSKTYTDRYGLRYDIYKSGYTVGNAEKDNRRSGQLISIEYTIPQQLEEKMFVEER